MTRALPAMTSSNPDYVSKASSADAITLGVRGLQWENLRGCSTVHGYKISLFNSCPPAWKPPCDPGRNEMIRSIFSDRAHLSGEARGLRVQKGSRTPEVCGGGEGVN